MPQFLVLAYDGTDSGASARRQAAYSAQHDHLRLMAEKGEIIAGRAILGDSGDILGSAMFVDFASHSELDDWLTRNPYAVGGVWKDIDVKPLEKVYIENKSLIDALKFLLYEIVEWAKKWAVFKFILAFLGLFGISSIVFYFMVASYSNRYSIPVVDTVKELDNYINLLFFAAFIFVVVACIGFLSPMIMRLYFPIKAINTTALFRLNSKRKNSDIFWLYYWYALPLTAPGSIFILLLHAYLIFISRQDPEFIPEWLSIILVIIYSALACAILPAILKYRWTIKRRFQVVRRFNPDKKAEEYIASAKKFISSTVMYSLVVLLVVYVVFAKIALREQLIPFFLATPLFVILYYMYMVVVSGFYSVDEPKAGGVAQKISRLSYENIIRILQAKAALWIMALMFMLAYICYYPGLGWHTGVVLRWFNIGGGLPVTIYVDDSKQYMFNTNMWDEKLERNEHIFRYPLRPLKLILLGESKTYVYDDGAGGCPDFDKANTSKCESTFSIPTSIIMSIRMRSRKHLP